MGVFDLLLEAAGQGSRVFTVMWGVMSIEPPKAGASGGGVWEGAQLTGPLISHQPKAQKVLEEAFPWSTAFCTEYKVDDDCSGPLIPKLPFSLFWVGNGWMLGGPLIEPFLWEGVVRPGGEPPHLFGPNF